MTVLPVVISALCTVTKGLKKGTGGLGNKRTSGDDPNYCIIEIRDLRRLVVTQTPVKDHQLTLM